MTGSGKLDGATSPLKTTGTAIDEVENAAPIQKAKKKPSVELDDGAAQKAYLSSRRAHDATPKNPRLQVQEDRTVVAEEQYSKWAEKYDAETASYGWCAPAKLLEWSIDAVPPSSPLRVLDIGVGTGQAAAPYVEAGAQVTGLDISQNMLDEARENLPAFHHLAVYDINDPLSAAGVVDGTYDLITSCGTLHFAKDLGATIQTAADALADGGTFSFTYVPSQQRDFSSKTTPHKPSQLKAMVRRAGLELVEHELFTAYYDKGDKDDPVTYGRVIARKPGTPTEIPDSLSGMDRTTCVDRQRVLDLQSQPIISGPLGTSATASGGFTKAMMKAVRDQLAAGQQIDVAAIPLPDTTPAASMQGEPKTDVLALLAHPDDESVYLGGTMGRFADAGLEVKLVHSTGGNGGRGGVDPNALADTREAEQLAALEALGIPIENFVGLGFDDFGKYRDNATRSVPATAADTLTAWGLDKIVGALVEQIRRERPDTVVSFEPTRDPNFSLHGHHLGMGIATMLAYHMAADPDAFPEQIAGGLKPWAPRHHEVIVPHGTPTDRRTEVTFDGERKLAGLVAHASQRYSTDRLLTRMRQGDPDTRFETWHRLQSRAPEDKSAIQQLEEGSG